MDFNDILNSRGEVTVMESISQYVKTIKTPNTI